MESDQEESPDEGRTEELREQISTGKRWERVGSSGADTQSEWEKNDQQGWHVAGEGKRKRKGEDT